MSTTYQNLSLPVVSVTAGPSWANLLNAALTVIDAHDHTTNKGARVPTSGLNINANLDLGGYSPYNAKSVMLAAQSATLTGTSNANSVFSYGGNLYYTNSAGNAVQITSAGAIAAAPSTSVVLDGLAIINDETLNDAVHKYTFVSVDTSSLAIKVTLPEVAAISEFRFIKVADASGNAQSKNITVTAHAGETINGASTFVIKDNYACYEFVADGGKNWILS
jgi:hypothetical protein